MTSMIIDSLQAVPQKYRQASAGLGATRWQTISGNNSECEERDFNGNGIWNGTDVW